MITVEVRMDRPAARVFEYLADPANRPAWQSSLRRVEPLTEQTVGVGARWRDVTVLGLRPTLEVTAHEPARRWAERGSWRGVAADLTLTFEAIADSRTRVLATVSVGRPRLLGRVLLLPPARVLVGAALRRDLLRAARRIA